MNHFNILGRSIADPVVESYLAEHEKLDPTDFRTNAEMGFFGGFDSGFGLQVESFSAYSAEFEDVRSRHLPDDEERIVSRLSFTGLDAIRAVQRAYMSALPFGLTFGDCSDVVAQKLGTGPFQEIKSSTLPEYSDERFDHSHAVGNLVVIAKYDAGLLLMAVYLMHADRTMLKAKRRKAFLPKHKIMPGNVDKVEALRGQIPTPRWRESMAEGDELFNEPDIAVAEAALNAFVDTVKAATSQRDAQAIQAAVKDIVLAINEINGRSGMIETLERDELGVLIDAVVRASGFSLPDDEDITAQWREW
ncbi:hypothetical protein J2855_002788 [Agrobacterium tumefaciens]|uniref:hypothetical protein n=1 Tax=Agrobacterium tumefaciens TaxID=358 RepID=UPI000DD07D95|nr:hypothetical protein [Agrobacterium tumefaciens]MBP2509142.1 hypothetical protein [Agrobacterium tumefaciens]MBP2518295.1 hypothetical protein [Agrobacterium tumefaciens]MBP2576928.1 hypothetical protein [Agrobacterium tumefaciens]MBP2594891.1 hypothetical protein [Agrobacterium tumefaciens]